MTGVVLLVIRDHHCKTSALVCIQHLTVVSIVDGCQFRTAVPDLNISGNNSLRSPPHTQRGQFLWALMPADSSPSSDRNTGLLNRPLPSARTSTRCQGVMSKSVSKATLLLGKGIANHEPAAIETSPRRSFAASAASATSCSTASVRSVRLKLNAASCCCSCCSSAFLSSSASSTP